MLKQWEKTERPSDAKLEERLQEARRKLQEQQLKVKEHGLPVLVLVEGWGTAGKGSLIGQIIKNIDPRFFKVASMAAPTEEEKRKPFLYRHFVKIPESGKFSFLDSGWMDEIMGERLHEKLGDEAYAHRIESVKRFERQLTDNGYLVVKLFLQVSKKEQEKRIEHLSKEKDTRWRVSRNDRWQNEHYEKCLNAFDSYLKETNLPSAPWYIIDAESKKWTELQVLEILTEGIDVALANNAMAVPILQNVFSMEKMPLLSEIPQDKTIGEDEYKKELKRLQNRLGELHNRLYRKKVPVIIAYEGWDAAGKGGNIKRSPEHSIREAMKYIRSHARSHTRRRDIISGVSGRGCQRQDISRSLTAPGMAESWWSVLRGSAAKMTGNVPITKLMNLKRNCTTGALLSSSSGCRSTRIHS